MARTFGLVVIISVITVDFCGFVLGLSVDNQLANARNGKSGFLLRVLERIK